MKLLNRSLARGLARAVKRHVAKTITWRIIGTLDTFVVSWFFSGNHTIAFQIMGFELISKMILYYLHERVWFKSKVENTNKRHILKTFTWRTIGTLDTFLLSWLITGNPITSFKIGFAEIFSKMLLYFGHEKLWYGINYGLYRRQRAIRLKKIRRQRKLRIL